ncbi:MAG: hypothetical protein REI12_08730 [Pedobacter sp.]|nr:hypothetical protein [Pedobacter sp.]
MSINSMQLRVFMSAALALASALGTFNSRADTLVDADLQKRVNAALGVMSFALTPDVTTGSLSLSNAPTSNPDFAMTTLGGGATMSKSVPIYLEGTAGYSRYDPTFIVSDGTTERPIPTKWNNLSLTGGVGWDFPVAEDLVLRPIFNFSLGRVASDAKVASAAIAYFKDKDIQFLENGTLDAYGLGGSLVLDYERYREANEVDVELRYTNIVLNSYGDTSAAVEGRASSQILSLWSRWRAPTRFTLLDKPLRYVLEAARTEYLGDMRGALGFNALNSLGVGLELDSSKYNVIVTRTRMVFRYQFGDHVEGTSVGIAVSF